MAAKPWKSSITVWLMRWPSRASTVRVIRGTPPSSRRGVDLGRAVAGDVHPQVTHDGDAVDALAVCREMDEDEGVRALVGGLAGCRRGPGVHAAVAADQQDVQRDGRRIRRRRRVGVGLGGDRRCRGGRLHRGRGLGPRPVQQERGGGDGEHHQPGDDGEDNCPTAVHSARCRGWARRCFLWIRRRSHGRTLPPGAAKGAETCDNGSVTVVMAGRCHRGPAEAPGA